MRALLRETIVIGTATDPYQPAERRYRITRGVLEVLAEQRGLSVTIITKSPLVTRDVDVLMRIASRLARSRCTSRSSRPIASWRAGSSRAPHARSAPARDRAPARARNRGRRQRDAGAPGHHRRSASARVARALRRRGERVVPRRVRAAASVDGAAALPAVHREGVSASRGALPLHLCAQPPGRRALPAGAAHALQRAVRGCMASPSTATTRRKRMSTIRPSRRPSSRPSRRS